jgi:hypothetical protein
MPTKDLGLEYASPSTPDPSLPGRSRITPEELRFRRRLKFVLVSLIILGLIPYPTQVCPPVTVQLVDANAKPVLDIVSLEWRGHANAGSLDAYVPFDMTGRATVSRQWTWANPFGRFLSLIPFPHGGGGWMTTSTTLILPLPADLELDTVAMGLTPSWLSGTRSDWTDPKTGRHFSCYGDTLGSTPILWVTIDPGWLGSSPTTLKIVLRRIARPATLPVPADR